MSDPLADWDYDLPDDRIARYPTSQRTGSRLLHLPLAGGGPVHLRFPDLLERLRPGDLLVGNDTRVMAARLFARRATGGRVELLALSAEGDTVEVLARPARRLKHEEVLELDGGGTVQILRSESGPLRARFDRPVVQVMDDQGELPLPPYFGRQAEPADADRYQTVYSGPLGAAAAPTAGLHFTDDLLDAARQRGVSFATVTLHVGIGTFRPLRPEDVERGSLHSERYHVPESTWEAIHAADRVIAIGTTSARTLESAGGPGWGTTELFIKPGTTIRRVDGLITNFHLPRSSLLMLVAALVGRERLLAAYEEAVHEGYRFYSYGDAMLLL